MSPMGHACASSASDEKTITGSRLLKVEADEFRPDNKIEEENYHDISYMIIKN